MSSLKFQLYKPGHGLNRSDGPPPAWLHETRSLRSNILYANGRRPAFGPGGDRFGDFCARDPHSFHITVRVGEKLVGCVRGLPLSGEQSNAVLDDVMGHGKLDRSLEFLKAKRDQCIEVSRLILDAEFRASKIARHLVASIWAVGWHLNSSMLVAGLGTYDYQDKFFARFGGRPLPDSELVSHHAFDDHIRPMYAWTHTPGHAFAGLVHQMHDYFFGGDAIPLMAAG